MHNQVTAANIGVTDAVKCAVGRASHSGNFPEGANTPFHISAIKTSESPKTRPAGIQMRVGGQTRRNL